MDSNSSRYFLSPSTIQSVYYHQQQQQQQQQAKEGHGNGVIDLGLSLRTLQPESYHPSGHLSLEGYDDLLDWPLKSSTNMGQPRNNNNSYIEECSEEDGEGIQSKEKWAYVKVNMDGVIVGRKICILDHGNYSSLALQLEDMFGRQSITGIRLFQAGSEFSLFYKDRFENWRNVGDVPWKEFVECVKRLRIARKIE